MRKLLFLKRIAKVQTYTTQETHNLDTIPFNNESNNRDVIFMANITLLNALSKSTYSVLSKNSANNQSKTIWS